VGDIVGGGVMGEREGFELGFFVDGTTGLPVVVKFDTSFRVIAF
jgi:hypothetical protein